MMSVVVCVPVCVFYYFHPNIIIIDAHYAEFFWMKSQRTMVLIQSQRVIFSPHTSTQCLILCVAAVSTCFHLSPPSVRPTELFSNYFNLPELSVVFNVRPRREGVYTEGGTPGFPSPPGY